MRLILMALPLALLLPVGAAQAQVGGSYRQSCTNVSQNGSTLYARCRGSNGQYNDTSIDVDQCRGQGIANSFGRLTCGGVKGQSEPSNRGGDDFGNNGGGRRFNRNADDGQYGGGDYRAPRPRYGQPDDDGGYVAPRPRPRRYDPDQDY